MCGISVIYDERKHLQTQQKYGRTRYVKMEERNGKYLTTGTHTNLIRTMYLVRK